VGDGASLEFSLSGLVGGSGVLGSWVGSAGLVLRSQGTSGQEGLSRWRAWGMRVLTFQCSLRLRPAAASVAATANAISATATTTTTYALLGVLEERGSIGTGFQTGRGQAQRLLVWVGDGAWVGSAGLVLRSQGTSGQEGLSRWRARGMRVLTFQCSLRLSPASAWA
jgi:hypothetical protein